MNYPFKGGRAVDASEKIFGASLDACWYHALLGLIQASGLAGGYDSKISINLVNFAKMIKLNVDKRVDCAYNVIVSK